MPAIVPRTVAASDATTAMNSELVAALSISALWKSFVYQLVVKPTHSAESFESLNENTTTTASGMYRNRYTAIADPTRSFDLRMFDSATRQPRGEAGDREHRDREHQRQHRPERPVARAEEALLDQVADQP